MTIDNCIRNWIYNYRQAQVCERYLTTKIILNLLMLSKKRLNKYTSYEDDSCVIQGGGWMYIY